MHQHFLLTSRKFPCIDGISSIGSTLPSKEISLNDSLSENEILVLAKKLGKRPKEFIRTSEKDFKDNNIKSLIDNDRALAKAMEGLPKIMERPIFVVGENAVIGRPPENILTLLDK